MAKTEKEIIVWTMAKSPPFQMGGPPWYPMGLRVKVKRGDKKKLGRGYCGYVVVAPNGKTFIAEADTGAFVGPSLTAVRKDIREGDTALMETQMREAHSKKNEVKVKDADEFWRILKCQAQAPTP